MYVYMYFYIFVSIYSFILFILFIYNKYINIYIYIYAAHVDLKVEDIRLVGSPLPWKSWMAPFGWDR